MPTIDLSQDIDGRWTVTLPGLVLSELTREAADAFVAAYRSLKALSAAPEATGAGACS